MFRSRRSRLRRSRSWRRRRTPPSPRPPRTRATVSSKKAGRSSRPVSSGLRNKDIGRFGARRRFRDRRFSLPCPRQTVTDISPGTKAHSAPAIADQRRSRVQAILSSAAPADTEGREFLTFHLAGEEYAIEILKVQEIRGWEVPTAIAGTPDFIKGVINLRDIIVPVVDLRLKFKGEAKYDEFTVLIILSVARRVVGIVVDAVSDVTTLAPTQIRAAPEFAAP